MRKTRSVLSKGVLALSKTALTPKQLIQRLRDANDELQGLDQSDNSRKIVSQIQHDLGNKTLLAHTNGGVQVLVCCCIAEILRIHAPDSPFDLDQLSKIFRLMFKQFRKLNAVDNPYYDQYCTLLKKVAQVNSICLMADLPDNQELIEELFEVFYGLAAKDNFPTRLLASITDMMAVVISEVKTISQTVLRYVLSAFLLHEAGDIPVATPTSNIHCPALVFSLTVCETNMELISRQLAQYFSEVLYDSTEKAKESSSANAKEELADQLLKIHRLSVRIWKFVPGLLGAIVGLFEEELKATDVHIRIIATETLGLIIHNTNPTKGVNFFTSHKSTWNLLLRKATDISPLVRGKLAEQIPKFIDSANNPTTETNTVITNLVCKGLMDVDERVRIKTCKSLSTIKFGDIKDRLCNKNLISTLNLNVREKSPEVRNLSIQILSNVYENYCKHETNSSFGTHSEIECEEIELMIKQIPSTILSLTYINDKNINYQVDISLFESLTPLAESSSRKRVDRLLQLFSTLDAKSKQSFFAINERQQNLAKVVDNFISLSEDYFTSSSQDVSQASFSGSIVQGKELILNKLDKIINWLVDSFPTNKNTYGCFDRLFKVNNTRIFQLMKICISPESDYNTIRSSMKELVIKLRDSANIQNNDGTPLVQDMVTNMKLLLYRSSGLLYNRSNIPVLISYVKDTYHDFNGPASEILVMISKVNPQVLRFHVDALVNLILESPEDPSEIIIPITTNLKTLYNFFKVFPELFPSEVRFIEKLKRISLRGSPKIARYCIKIIGVSPKKEIYCASIIHLIYPLDLDSPQFVTHLSIIAEICQIDSLSVQDKYGQITETLIKKVFKVNRNLNGSGLVDDTHESWLDDTTLDVEYRIHSIYEKLLGFRFLINKLKSQAYNVEEEDDDSERDRIMRLALPVLTLFISTIGNSGEIVRKECPSWPTPETYKLKLRLAAGLSILKLAKIPIYNQMIDPTTLRRLSFLLTDPNPHVRELFMNCLQRNINDGLISERFLAILYFIALEDKPEAKRGATMWIKSLFKRQEGKFIKFEKSLVRLIHIIAHHEHFISLLEGDKENNSSQIEAYTYAIKILIFCVKLIATSENISLLYYFANRVKQYRDATVNKEVYESDEASASDDGLPSVVLNLYRIADLALMIIKEYGEMKGWVIPTWPGKIKLPSDIFIAMSSASELQSIQGRVYITDRIQLQLKTIIKSEFVGLKRKHVLSDEKERKVTSKRTKTKRRKLEKPIPKSKQKVDNLPTRRSGRTTGMVNYAEVGSDEDEDEDQDEPSSADEA